MLRLDPEAWSLRWYQEIASGGVWTRALANSLLIGIAASLLATALGTIAALGLSNPAMPARRLVTAVLISPMVIPLVIAAAGNVLLLFRCGSGADAPRAHSSRTRRWARPFVVITVTATLSGYDRNLTRAAQSLGADALTAFRRVQLPLIAPGVISGAVFAFAASFDEVVVVLFMGGLDQRTIPGRCGPGSAKRSARRSSPPPPS